MFINNILILLLLPTIIFFLNFYLQIFSIYEYLLFTLESNQDNDNYDFIIVGSGTAGSLIAHYLAQTDAKFIILEAGGSGGPMLNAPAMGPFLHGTIHDWKYKTTKQDNACLAMNENRCIWPAGKIVGGSGKISNMIHIKSFVDEIVPWFNGKYSHEQLLNHLIDLERTDLSVDNLKFKTELSSAILNSGFELGYKVVNQSYDSKFGFMEVDVNQLYGGRWTTSHTLLNNNLNRGRLVSNAFVEKILIDIKSKVAQGVIYEKFGKKFKIHAKKVIINSGAIGTPKLLLLSGIGPKDHLSKINIPLVKNLPVGKNLIDHVSTGLDLVILNKTLELDLKSFLNPYNAWDYYVNGNGPWTTPGCEIIAFFDTNNNKNYSNNQIPDLQFMVLPVGLSADYGSYLHDTVGINETIWKNYFDKVKNSITILPIVLHPKSTGYVELNSKDPSEPPLINPNYFSNQKDVEIIIEGIRIIKEIINTKSMQKLGAKLNTNIFPGCEQHKFDTNNYWDCYIRHLTFTTFHPAGTCRMGDTLNDISVVDHDFRVIGIENLYVVDASIFPTLPSGNINMAVALVAKVFTNELIKGY